MMRNPMTHSSYTVRDHITWVRIRIDFFFFSSTPGLVSGHAIQIKDLNGDEPDGLDECPFFPCIFSGMPVMNEIIRYLRHGLLGQRTVPES